MVLLGVTNLVLCIMAFSRSMVLITMRLLLTTVRTLLIEASVCHSSVSRLDVKNAFLNGVLLLTTCFLVFITLTMALSKPLAPGLSVLPLWWLLLIFIECS